MAAAPIGAEMSREPMGFRSFLPLPLSFPRTPPSSEEEEVEEVEEEAVVRGIVATWEERDADAVLGEATCMAFGGSSCETGLDTDERVT